MPTTKPKEKQRSIGITMPRRFLPTTGATRMGMLVSFMV
jgi:hypothetical protein